MRHWVSGGSGRKNRRCGVQVGLVVELRLIVNLQPALVRASRPPTSYLQEGGTRGVGRKSSTAKLVGHQQLPGHHMLLGGCHFSYTFDQNGSILLYFSVVFSDIASL